MINFNIKPINKKKTNTLSSVLKERRRVKRSKLITNSNKKFLRALGLKV